MKLKTVLIALLLTLPVSLMGNVVNLQCTPIHRGNWGNVIPLTIDTIDNKVHWNNSLRLKEPIEFHNRPEFLYWVSTPTASSIFTFVYVKLNNKLIIKENDYLNDDFSSEYRSIFICSQSNIFKKTE